MNIRFSEEEYNILIEALVLYSSTHHREFLAHPIESTPFDSSRDRWLKSHGLIVRLEMIEGQGTGERATIT